MRVSAGRIPERKSSCQAIQDPAVTPVPEAVRLRNDRPLRTDTNRGYSAARTTRKVLNDIYEFRAAPSNAASGELAALGAQAERPEMGNLAQAGCRPRTMAHSSRPIRHSIWESPS